MKLNADILYDELSLLLKVQRAGEGKKALCLERPEFYGDNNYEFLENHLYICRTDRLRSDSVMRKGMVLLCVGGPPSSVYTTGAYQTCCLWLEQEYELLSLFNQVQKIFNRYDEWELELQKILKSNANIQEIVDCSFRIFENPLVVMDADFRVLAYSGVLEHNEDMADFLPDENGKYAASLISESLMNMQYNRALQKAFIVTDPERDLIHFSTNLYTGGKFIGNLKISFFLRPHRESDNALGCYLARILEDAFLYNPRLMDNHVDPLGGILKDLLNGIPIEHSRKRNFYTGGIDGWYLCAKIIPSSRTSSKVTSFYMLRHIETTFPGCCAFEKDAFLVVFIDLVRLECEEQAALHRLENMLKEMELRAGVSCPFQDLLTARSHFRQATLALELGSSVLPEQRCHCFADYKLSYMCLSSLGEFSAEDMMTAGLAKLVRHDANSQTNYMETLSVYLNNNLNSSKTAQELYIHRSTFQERIQRIESLLDADLSAPGQRLYLMIMLKILQDQNLESKGNETALTMPEPKESPLLPPKYPVRILDEY